MEPYLCEPMNFMEFKTLEAACEYLDKNIRNDVNYERRFMGKDVTSILVWIDNHKPVYANFNYKDFNGSSTYLMKLREQDRQFSYDNAIGVDF